MEIEKQFYIYVHLCSLGTLYYLIPEELNAIIKGYKDLQYYEFDKFELNTIELGIENIK